MMNFDRVSTRAYGYRLPILKYSLSREVKPKTLCATEVLVITRLQTLSRILASIHIYHCHVYGLDKSSTILLVCMETI